MTRRRSAATTPHQVPIHDLPDEIVVAGLFSVAGPPAGRWAERDAGDLTVPQLRSLVAAVPNGLSVARGRVLDCRIVDGVLDADSYDAHTASGSPIASAIVDELRWAHAAGLLDAFPGEHGMSMVAELALQELERLAPAHACRISVADNRNPTTLVKVRWFADIDMVDFRRELDTDQIDTVIERAERDLRILRTLWVRADDLVADGAEPMSAFERSSRFMEERFRNRFRAAYPEPPDRDMAVLERATVRLRSQLGHVTPGERHAAWRSFAGSLVDLAADGIPQSVVALRPHSPEATIRGGLGG